MENMYDMIMLSDITGGYDALMVMFDFVHVVLRLIQQVAYIFTGISVPIIIRNTIDINILIVI